MAKVKLLYTGDLHTECTHESGALIQTDAPKDNQGKGEFFSPTDLIAAGLGSCMLTLMGARARKLGLDLRGMTAEVVKEMATTGKRRIVKLIVRMRSSHLPNPQERESIEQAALDCPVHHSLHPEIKVETDFVWGL